MGNNDRRDHAAVALTDNIWVCVELLGWRDYVQETHAVRPKMINKNFKSKGEMNETWYLDEPAFGETNRLMSKVSTMIIGCSVGEVQAKR